MRPSTHRGSLLFLFLAAACATDGGLPQGTDESDTGSRIVLVSGDEPPLVLRPAPRRAPVEVMRAEYEAAMVRYARELRDELPPLPSKRLEVISWGSPEQRDERDHLGRDRAGKSISNGQHTLRLDKDGFPEFDTKFECLLDDIHIGSGNPAAHIKAANQRLHQAISQDPGLARVLQLSRTDVANLPRRSRPPSGYRWHHHQDVGRMQLIRHEEHELAIPHTGGMAIWGGGYP